MKARLEPGGREFLLDPDDSILNCALRQGVILQYGCRNGRCSSCKYRLLDGEVDFGKTSPYCLTENEKDDGWALLCQARALSDLVIGARDMPDRDDAPIITPQTRVAAVAAARPLNRSLWLLELDLVEPIVFYPGQYVEVGVPGRDDAWRCYSLAGAPANRSRLDLIVKRIDGGLFSPQVARLMPGASLKLRGPYGMSYLRPGDRPVLLIATGSGIAPLMSIVRFAAAQAPARSFELYYGARHPEDLVFVEELRELEKAMPAFRFVPTLSAAPSDGRWQGASGRVTQTLQREIADASPYDAYICGQPEMCEAVAALLLAKGIPEHRIFRDDFFAAA